MSQFAGLFPGKGRGPKGNTQGLGPLVARAGEGKVPVRVPVSRAVAPRSSLPFSQHTRKKEMGSVIEREPPPSVEVYVEVLAKESQKNAKEDLKVF